MNPTVAPSLAPCWHCGRPVSCEARSCPHCGALRPVPNTTIPSLIVGAFLLIGLCFCLAALRKPPPADPRVLTSVPPVAELRLLTWAAGDHQITGAITNTSDSTALGVSVHFQPRAEDQTRLAPLVASTNRIHAHDTWHFVLPVQGQEAFSITLIGIESS